MLISDLSGLFLWAGMSEELLGPVLNFFHSMAAISVTDAEYALLVATSVLCSGLLASHNADFYCMQYKHAYFTYYVRNIIICGFKNSGLFI